MSLPEPKKRLLFDTVTVLASATILLWRAIVAGYPLIHYDTGTYISACFDHFIPIDRPLTYSYFIRHMSLAYSLWLAVIAQTVVLSWVMLMLFRHLAAIQKPWPWHFAASIFLAFTTGVAVNAAQLIADVFSSIVVLSFALFVFTEPPRLTRIFLCVVLVYGITVHFSHYPLYCVLLGIVFLARVIRRKQLAEFITWRKLLFAALAVPVAVLLTLLINRTQEKTWQFSSGSGHIMMVNRLLNSGILDSYLDENCPKHHYTLCDYRQNEWNLLWADSSSLNVYYGFGNKGWLKAKPEYDSIINDVLSQPKYVRQFIAACIRDWGKQLLRYDIEGMDACDSFSATGYEIREHFDHEWPRYYASGQATHVATYFVTNDIQRTVVPITTGLLLFFLVMNMFTRYLDRRIAWSAWMVIAAVVFNALTCVTFAMICSRFQSRVVWLLPLMLILIIAHLISNHKWKTLFRKQ